MSTEQNIDQEILDRQSLWGKIKELRLPWIPLVVLVSILVLAAGADLIAPHDPTPSTAKTIMYRLIPPFEDWSRPLGTDNLGRDVLSRLIHGTRTILIVSVPSLVLAVTVGTAVGLVSGYARGWTDTILMRITDAVMGFPSILVALLIVSLLGTGLVNVLIAVTVTTWSRFARMIRGVFKLDKTVAREIMVPRVDVTAMDITTSLDSVVDTMLSSGHSKIPIYREDLDRIEGIAHSMDILRFLSDANGTRSINLEQCLRPVIFIPESKTLEDLLTEFQEKRMQMSIVIDEYGGVSGLVTVEDLVEEIVGELHDEFDRGESEIRKISDTEYYMDAGIDIDDITQTIGIPFEGEGFDTIGGFVLHQLGKIPSPGDEFSYNGLNIQVISTLGRRLKSLKITTTTLP